jgi:periplasmic protein TonB
MFEQAVLTAPPSHRLFGTFAGVTCQAILVGSLILAPMLFPQMLPDVHSMVFIVAPSPPPAPPAPGPTVRPHAVVRAATHICSTCMPISIPQRVAIVVDDPPEIASGPYVAGMELLGNSGGGKGPGVVGSVMDLFEKATAPPAPLSHPAPVKPAPVAIEPPRVTGGVVKMANPIHRVEPIYPPLAKQARVSGTVEIEAVIGVDGRLREVHVKSGHPLLVKAAVDAVRQWVYEPTTLNGMPVEVAGVILVTFRLN